jgi:hypothetical protein
VVCVNSLAQSDSETPPIINLSTKHIEDQGASFLSLGDCKKTVSVLSRPTSGDYTGSLQDRKVLGKIGSGNS